MERGGVVIKRSSGVDARIDLDLLETQNDIAAAVMRAMVDRHKVLYRREGHDT